MKLLSKIIALGNIITSSGALVYVLKEIIHNKDSNSFILGIYLALVFISYNSLKDFYKEYLFKD